MKILITAGPTREAIDPVRYISNRSSGKMGYAIAEAARHNGHEVVLVSGPVTPAVPEGADVINIESADEMYEAVESRLTNDVDAAVFCAAVADYRPVETAQQKIKKGRENQMSLTLEKTRDILGSARSEMGFKGLLIGFAAETEDLEEHARQKLESKQCDLIAANLVNDQDSVFDSPDNELHLFFADGRSQILERQSKVALGKKLIEIIEKLNEAGA